MIFIPFILFSGFTTNTENIILPLKAIEYISPMRYVFEFMVRNEFSGHEELLGDSHPLKTLNFTFSNHWISIFIVFYICFLVVTSIFTLKYNSKGVIN